MVHVHDAPLVGFLTKGRAARLDFTVGDANTEVVLDPDRIPEVVMRPRSDGKLCRRMLLEVVLPVILHRRCPSVKIAPGGEQNDGGIEAVGERALIGAVERGFAGEQLLMEFRDLKVSSFGVRWKPGRMVLQIDSGAPLTQQVDSKNTVNGAAASAPDRR